MAGVPFVFGNATTSIPLSNLDANFNTGVTIGNTTVGLGNTVTTFGNVTLNNTNFASGLKVTGALASSVATSTLLLDQNSSSSSRILVAGADAGTPPTLSTVLLNNAGGVFGATTLYDTGLAVKSLGINGTTPSSSGTGITFPATQSASSNANTLDDYEEGTWTPSFTNTTITGSPVYSGTYTKIGRMVYVSAFVGSQTAFTSTNNSSYINNLPFTISGANTVGNASSDGVGNFGPGVFFNNSTQFYIPTISVLTNSVYFTGWYLAAT